MLTALGAKARAGLRSALQSRAAVDALFIDEESGSVWVVCPPSVDTAEVERAIAAGLSEAGLDPGDIQIRLLADAASRTHKRVRLLATDREESHDGCVQIRTSLEWEGRVHRGTASGERSEQIELRTAALATLDALRGVVGPDLDLRLVGIKQFRAFDTELVVVSIYRPGTPPQRFVGAVLRTEGPVEAACRAVLHALNRLLGNYLDRGE